MKAGSKQHKSEQQRSDAKMTALEQQAEELVTSFENGNRSSVLDEIIESKRERVAQMALVALVAQQLGSIDLDTALDFASLLARRSTHERETTKSKTRIVNVGDGIVISIRREQQ